MNHRSTKRLKTPIALLIFSSFLSFLSAVGNLRGQQDVAPFISEQDLSVLHFRNIGPAVMGGRITALAVDKDRPRVFYVGSASGNLWKTVNYGTTFKPLFEDQGTASIGALAIAPSEPKRLYLGTGEATNRQSSSWGNGIYRSDDEGETWRLLGLEETRHIGRIVVDPNDADTLYVAALGHLWGPNPERGLFRSRNGGQSWERVLFVDDDTGVSDVIMHPGDSRLLFAATYQRRRTGFGFNGGGPGSAIHRSRDGGDNWEVLKTGLPSGHLGRIGLAIDHQEGNRIYALIETNRNETSGLYTSSDGGGSWKRMNGRNPRPMYFSHIHVDPTNAEIVWVLGQRLHMSRDGGRSLTFDSAAGVHPDHHVLWIDPSDPQRMILGGDGGLSLSFDGGHHWRMLDNLPLAQFYKLAVDDQRPYWVYGGLQDNGTWTGPSAVWDRRGIRNADWLNLSGGDGFYAQLDPQDPTTIISESQRGGVVLVDLPSGTRQSLAPSGVLSEGEQRWNWSSPILVSSHDRRVLYLAANVLFRSSDRGVTWRKISQDLSKGIDRSELTIMRALPTIAAHDGIRSYGTITALAESPLNPALLYVGTDDGNFQVSRDGGGTWSERSAHFPQLPARAYVSSIWASKSAAGRVYAAFDAHRQDDNQAYVYASDDFGGSWRPINQGLPSIPVSVIIEDSRNSDLLFVGNEIGLFFSLDRGVRWQALRSNLPTVPVDDLLVHQRENDLVVGTHGRGVWILDDISPLQEWHSRQDQGIRFFSLRPTPVVHLRRVQAWTGHSEYAGENPPQGALIRYALEDTSGSLKLTIQDSEDREIRSLDAPRENGLHQVIWDLNLSPGFHGGGDDGRRARPVGPQAAPGRYTVRLQADEGSFERELILLPDPRVQIADEDRRLRREILVALNDLGATFTEALKAARRSASDLGQWIDDTQSKSKFHTAARAQRSSLVQMESRLRLESRIAARLLRSLDQTPLRPTQVQIEDAVELHRRLEAQVKSLNQIRLELLPSLQRRLLPKSTPRQVVPITLPAPFRLDWLPFPVETKANR